MRLFVFGISGILLSGCSWLGHVGEPGKSYHPEGKVTSSAQRTAHVQTPSYYQSAGHAQQQSHTGTYVTETGQSLRGAHNVNNNYPVSNVNGGAGSYNQAGYAGHAGGFAPHAYGNLGGIAYGTDGAFGVQARLGYNFHKNFGVEGEGSFGIIDEKETIGGTEFSAGVNYSAAAYGVARLPIGDRFSVLGRGGYHYSEIDASFGALSGSTGVDGFAAGGGVEFMIDEKNGLRGDYTYVDASGGNLDTFSLSYVRKF